MSEFQSIGVAGSGADATLLFAACSYAERVVAFSFAMTAFHCFSERSLSHARTVATSFPGEWKKSGYSNRAIFHFAVRNSMLLFISTGVEGVTPFVVAAAISSSVGDICFQKDGIV